MYSTVQKAVRSAPWSSGAAQTVARSMSTQAGKYLSVEVRDGGVAVVRMDSPDGKMNTLSEGLQKEFKSVFEQLRNDSSVKATVLISSKSDNFIAGADINMLSACKSADELQALSEEGQRMLAALADSPKPIVAAINGACLGGGLEVALACHYRVASSNSKTVLALPEVMLGLLPGAGGTQRLPRLIGIPKALDMMLTGKNIRADRAKKMGLVDVVADPAALEDAAVLCARQLVNGTLKPREPKKGLMNVITEDISFTRDLVFKKAAEAVTKKSGGHYPAPYKILNAVKAGFEKGVDAGYKEEAVGFGQLGMTNESKSLISLFFGQTALKKNRFGKPERKYENIGVLGAGLMGAGIAQVSLQKGMNVLLKDRNVESLSRGEQQIYNNLSTRVKRRSLAAFDRDTIMSRLTGVTAEDCKRADAHFSRADMVIEAVFEDLNVKHKVLAEMEAVTPDHCVFASNTSALPISDIAAAAKRPELVVGMHYFSPVDKMPLLEVITTDKTSKEASSAAVEVGLRQGKTVIVVKDGPGFYTTRILSPFMVEAAATIQDGAGLLELDNALKKYGFPVGPVTLLDEVGIDVGNHIMPTLVKAFGSRMEGADATMLKEFEAQGCLGRKSGKGFFLYGKTKPKNFVESLKYTIPALRPRGKQINPLAEEMVKKARFGRMAKPMTVEHMQERLVTRMVNEAAFCLQDGILANPVDGDIGAVFGLGFPPFYGGPFRWCDYHGAQKVVDMMNRLVDEYGDRFEPAPILKDMAKAGKKFHN